MQGRTCTGRSPLLVTLSLMRSRPLLSTIGSFLTIMAPGALFRANSEAATGGKASVAGTGKKEPYRAAARSPSSVQMGSCTVTRKTLGECQIWFIHDCRVDTHPSTKVPSTCISSRSAGTPGRTCRRPRSVLPCCIKSATECFPSRMRSWSCEAIRATASVWFRRRPLANLF